MCEKSSNMLASFLLTGFVLRILNQEYLYLMSLLSLRDAATSLYQMSMDIQEASPLPLGEFCV